MESLKFRGPWEFESFNTLKVIRLMDCSPLVNLVKGLGCLRSDVFNFSIENKTNLRLWEIKANFLIIPSVWSLETTLMGG